MSEVEINYSNLNLPKSQLLKLNGAAFRDGLAEAGFDGAEITPMRKLWQRRLLGKYSSDITRGMHASFAGRTFPEVARATLRRPSGHNVGGLAIVSAFREVEQSLPQMVGLQHEVGRKLDAVLYPQSGVSSENLIFDKFNAPFRRRTVQPTAQVLHRWGIDIAAGAPNDELLDQTRKAMMRHGIHAMTLDGFHARRGYRTDEGNRYELPEGFIDEAIDDGLVVNFHVSVGRSDIDLSDSQELSAAMIRETEYLEHSPDSFNKTQQGEWLRSAIGKYAGRGTFRITLEQPDLKLTADMSQAGHLREIVEAA